MTYSDLAQRLTAAGLERISTVLIPPTRTQRFEMWFRPDVNSAPSSVWLIVDAKDESGYLILEVVGSDDTTNENLGVTLAKMGVA